MGMDVYGKEPRTKEGEYFRNNVWWWRPLAMYCCVIAPVTTAACKHWQSNDGDGLDDKSATALADALQAEIDSGRTAQYALRRQSQIEMKPNEPCWLCDGTGTRKPVPDTGAGDLKAGGIKCNACDGTGHIRPQEDSYPFSVENVVEFVTFLRGCGGFEIN